MPEKNQTEHAPGRKYRISRKLEDWGDISVVASVDPKRVSDGGNGPTSDQLAWVREAIDGLRHSQNIAVTVLGGSIALLVAVFGAFMIWQAGEIKGLGDDMKAMEQRIVAKIDSTEAKLGNRIDSTEVKLGNRIDGLDAKVTDTRERVIRLEERVQSIAGRFDRGSAEPGPENRVGATSR
jgi:hypothetical protein